MNSYNINNTQRAYTKIARHFKVFNFSNLESLIQKKLDKTCIYSHTKETE